MQDHFVETSSNTAMYGGAAATITIWGLNLPEVAAIVTAAVAVVGAVVNVWYVVQKNRRAEEAHRAEMEGLRAGTETERRYSEGDG